MLEEPILALHLDNTDFSPEMYTISWFSNMFSMIFEVELVTRIWDYAICNVNFIVVFGVALMLELKDHLMLKDQSQLMSSIRNLEGISNIELCLSYAEFLIRTIPSGFFQLTYLKSKEE